MSKMNIKKGDTVKVLVGDEKEKGQQGKVVVAMPSENKVVVENLNMVKRHTKPRSAQQQGGIIDKPRAIDVSNVMLVCPKCGKATRVGHTKDENGQAARVCKKCGAVIDSKAKATEAKKTVKKSTKSAKKTKAEKAE